jgi:hypothetical protein
MIDAISENLEGVVVAAYRMIKIRKFPNIYEELSFNPFRRVTLLNEGNWEISSAPLIYDLCSSSNCSFNFICPTVFTVTMSDTSFSYPHNKQHSTHPSDSR